MIYVILNYDITLWNDDFEVNGTNSYCSQIMYEPNDELSNHEYDAVNILKEYINQNNIVIENDDCIEATVRLTLTLETYYDYFDGDCTKSDLLCADIMIYQGEELL